MSAEIRTPTVDVQPQPSDSDFSEPLGRFVDRTVKLLQIEDEAQQKRDRDAESDRPVSIRATARHSKTAFFDRIVVYFDPAEPMCSNIKTGAPVTIGIDSNDDLSIHGLFVGIEGQLLSIVFDSFMEDKIPMNEPCEIKLQQDSKVNAKLTSYLLLLKSGLFSNNSLLKARFSTTDGNAETSENAEKSHKNVDKRICARFGRSYKKLNNSQQAAVLAILNDDLPIRVVHGPPGTGKTTVLVEALLQICIERNKRVLCCGPSNKSVDNMLAALCASLKCKCGRCRQCRLSFVRFGHPVRIDPNLHKHCLDAKMDNRKRSLARLYELALQSKGKHSLSNIARLQRMNRLCAHRHILQESQIIFATLSSTATVYDMQGGCAKDNMFGWFDYVFVDECGQAMEAMCWAALTAADRAILFGDHCQLPPTVLSREDECEELKKSLLKQMVELRPDCVSLLDTQYRMNDKIAQWSSNRFYHGLVQSDPSVALRTIGDLVDPGPLLSVEPLVLIDTNKSTEGRLGVSWYNLDEAKSVYYYVENLLCSGICPQAIGVITPYSAQQNCIGQLLDANVYVSTVDGFQGQERDVIIFSTVRTSNYMEFVADPQRLNVAVTRAKRQFVLVGSLAKLRKVEICSSLINHMLASNGEVIHFSRLLRSGKSLASKLAALKIVPTQSNRPTKCHAAFAGARRSASADSTTKWNSSAQRKAISRGSSARSKQPPNLLKQTVETEPSDKEKRKKEKNDLSNGKQDPNRENLAISTAEIKPKGDSDQELLVLPNKFMELGVDNGEDDGPLNNAASVALNASTGAKKGNKGHLSDREKIDNSNAAATSGTAIPESEMRAGAVGQKPFKNGRCQAVLEKDHDKTAAAKRKRAPRVRKTKHRSVSTEEFDGRKGDDGSRSKHQPDLLQQTVVAVPSDKEKRGKEKDLSDTEQGPNRETLAISTAEVKSKGDSDQELLVLPNKFMELRIDNGEDDGPLNNAASVVVNASTETKKGNKERLRDRERKDNPNAAATSETVILGKEMRAEAVRQKAFKKSKCQEVLGKDRNKTAAAERKRAPRVRKTEQKTLNTEEFDEWKGKNGCPVCKRSINLLGIQCYACGRQYCPKHVQRELHECRKCY